MSRISRGLASGSQKGVDVKAAGGPSEWFDLGRKCVHGAAFLLELTDLAGGTTPDVDAKIETSPDKSAGKIVEVVATMGTPLTAVGNLSVLQAGPLFQFVRFTWITTGGPTTATADFSVQGGG